MLEWIGLIPLLGLTGNWRGYRMGGKAIGGANMSTDMKKKFEAARAAGNMDQAQAIADKTQKFNDDKKAEKAKAKEAKTINDAEKAEKAAKSVLTNDKRGQYDPMKSLSLQERTNLANSFIENSGMSKREAQSFVKKANDFSGGTVREYSKKKQFVDSNNRLYALSSNGKDFVLVGTYNKSGQIE